MTKKDQEIVLELKIKNENMLKVAGEAEAKIYALRLANSELSKELKKGNISLKEYSLGVIKNNSEIRKAKEVISILGTEMIANDKEIKKKTETLAELSKKIAELSEEYEKMSDVEKESAEGLALARNIEEQTEALRVAGQELGALSESLTKYQDKVLKSMGINNDFVKTLLSMGQSKKGFVDGMKSMWTSVQSFGKALWGIVTNPVGLVIVAIAAAGALLQKAFSKNTESTKKLNAAMAQLGVVFDTVLDILTPVVDFIIDTYIAALDMAITALSKFLSMLGFDDAAKSVDGFGQKLKEAAENSAYLKGEEEKLAKSQKELAKLQKAHERQAEKLKDIQNDESKSMKERLQAAEDLEKAVLAQYDKQIEVAKQAVKLANERVKLEKGTEASLEAQAAAQEALSDIMYNKKKAEKDSQKSIRTLRNQGASQGASDAKERRQKELEAQRSLQDSELKLLEEGLEKQRKETEYAYDRQIEDLKNRIATEKNLSAKAKEDLDNLIKNLEKQKKADLERLNDENFKNEAQKTQERLTLRLSYLKQESEEALEIRKQQLEAERKLALEAAEKAGIDKKLVNAKYDALIKQQEEDAKAAENAKLVAEEQRKLQEKLDLAKLEGESVLAIKLEAKQKELEELAQLEAESDEQFKIRQLTLQQEVKAAEIAVSEEKEAQKKKELDAYTAMFDSIGTLMEDFGANSAALGAFSKALTLYDIGLNTAKALSAGVASAQSIPFPGNLLAVATTITTIMTNISKAKKLLSSEKAPKAPKFATGGLVTGAGSGTSDSITAQLSNGESVITALGTQMFGPMLSAFNQIGGGAPIPLNSGAQQLQGKDMLAEAFKEAMQSMPNPVVSIQEINNTNKRVEVLEAYGVL